LLHDVALFAMETAMRMGEILSATGKYFDPNRATLVLPNSKNGHARTIPLSPTAMGMLLGKDHHAHALLFPTTTCAIKQAWKRATKRAGIVDLHFHDLRHEAISRLFERGLSLPEVALISGHRDPRMLLRYTHLEVSNVAAKLKRLESPIDA
jgi:integrase